MSKQAVNTFSNAVNLNIYHKSLGEFRLPLRTKWYEEELQLLPVVGWVFQLWMLPHGKNTITLLCKCFLMLAVLF